MKKTLVFVLSCETPPYDTHLRASLETWDTIQAEGVETVFYCGKSTRQSTDKVIYLNTQDTFANMGKKAVEGFEWALANRDFDYLARPNASCYVRKQLLGEYVQGLPDSNLYLGLKTASCYGVDYMWGGGAYILSRDVVKLIVDNKHLWNHNYTEDVSISDLLQKLGVPLTAEGRAAAIHRKDGRYQCITYDGAQGGGFDFTDVNDLKKLDRQFFFRVKQDGRRHEDIEIMCELFKNGI